VVNGPGVARGAAMKDREVFGFKLGNLSVAVLAMLGFWLVFVGIVVGTAPY